MADRPTIKEVAIRYVEGIDTEQTFTDEIKEEIVSEMENIPSTDDQKLREAVKVVLVEMAMNGQLDGDINDICIDTVFEKAENILQGITNDK
jgi:hypothetical protein